MFAIRLFGGLEYLKWLHIHRDHNTCWITIMFFYPFVSPFSSCIFGQEVYVDNNLLTLILIFSSFLGMIIFFLPNMKYFCMYRLGIA